MSRRGTFILVALLWTGYAMSQQDSVPPLEIDADRAIEPTMPAGLEGADAVDSVLQRGQLARLSFDLRGMYDSDCLRNDLVGALWRGETLGQDVRQRSRDDLSGRNRAGNDATARITYAWGDSAFGKAGLRSMISAGFRDVLGMRFTDDVYIMTFFGNAEYEGRTAALAPSAWEQQRYQTLGFGVTSAAGDRYLRLDVVNGQYLNAVQLDQADLYTAVDGEYLEADLDGYWRGSDTTGQTFGRSNGIGAALSGAYSFTGKGLRVGLAVEDLGFVAWNVNAQRIVKDEVIRYDGLYVADIVDLDGTILGEGVVRDTLGLTSVGGGFLRPLPARFALTVHDLKRGRRFRPRDLPPLLTIDQLAVPGYLPHVMLTRSLSLSRRWIGVGSVSYGGFGGLRLGVGAWCSLPWGRLRLDIPNLVGTLSPDAKGRAGTFGLDVLF